MRITKKQFHRELGLTVRYERLRAGLSRLQLAKLMDHDDVSELARLERGQRNTCEDCYWFIGTLLKIDPFLLLRRLTPEEKRQADIWDAEIKARQRELRKKKVKKKNKWR